MEGEAEEMNKKIIIFDLDGTLADIRHRRHFVENPNKKYGLDIRLSDDEEKWNPDWDAFHKACVDDAIN